MSGAAGKTETTELCDRRVTILYTNSDVAMIDEWRAKERIWSRGDAIRRLVLLGLEKYESDQKVTLTDQSSAA
jgi:hypothetical protein